MTAMFVAKKKEEGGNVGRGITSTNSSLYERCGSDFYRSELL